MKFIGNVLNVRSEDISVELRREFYMQWVPTSEVQRRILIEDAKEEAMIEVARSMLAEGLSIELIKKCTGVDEEDIFALGSSTT